MPVLDNAFIYDLESRLRVIQELEYARFMSKDNQWWDKVTRVQPSGSRRELFFWIVNSASIEPQGKGGNVEFDDMTIIESDYTLLDAGKGLKVRKNQFKDLDGNGVKVAESWTRQQTLQAAYWPQRTTSQLLLGGETGIGYDKQAFFSANHPNNGVDASNGTFTNLFTGGTSGTAPGACPIDKSVTLDVAFDNLSSVIAYIRSLKMPNGRDPRFLVPKFLIVPPALQTRAVLLTGAKQFALGAAGGAGTADVAGVISKWGLDAPIVADELAANITGTAGDDTSFYVGCEQMLEGSELGGLLYVENEPFGINYYSGENGMNFDLGRSEELAWLTHGRNVGGYGHPYAVFKVKST